jgi:CxxC motif-containing protein
MCPRGCELEASYEESGQILTDNITVTGNICPRGKEYAISELTDPKRNIATSVLVENGELPLASVRLTAPIPKDRIFEAMEEIKKVRLTAPVHTGQVVIENLLGLPTNVIVTKNVTSR